MDIVKLQDRLQIRVNDLLEAQRQERISLLKENDLYLSNQQLRQEYFFDFRLAWQQQCCEQIKEIDDLEKKNGRLLQKFIEMKIQRNSKSRNNLDR